MSGKPKECQNGWCTLNSRGLIHPPWTQPAGQSQEQSQTKEPPPTPQPAQPPVEASPGVLLSLTSRCRTLTLFLLFLIEWILDCKIPAAKFKTSPECPSTQVNPPRPARQFLPRMGPSWSSVAVRLAALIREAVS